MGRFKDEADVYSFLGRFIQQLALDSDLAPQVGRADTTLQYQLSDPQAQITMCLRPGPDLRVELGPTELEPEVVMAMATDTCHRFWLGKLNVTAALSRGEIQAKGPVAKVLRLVPLVEPAFPRYRQMLADAGRADLLEAA